MADNYEDSFAEFTKEDEEEKLEEEEQEEEKEDSQEDDQEEDLWAEASEAQQEALRKLQSERDEFRHKAESQSGRVSALQRKLNELEARQTQQAPRAATQQAAKPQPETDDEKRWKEFKEEYPELAQTMEEKLAREREQMRNEWSQSMQPFAQRLQSLSGVEYERYVESQERTLDAAHPDWRDIAKSEDFTNWVRTLPKSIAGLYESDDASEVAFLLDHYKRTATQNPQESGNSEVSEIKRQREERLRSSQEPPAARSGGGRPIPKDDFESAFAAYAHRAERNRRG